MTILRTIITDLREKRLWPVVALLLGALVAVPILLSTTSPSSDMKMSSPTASAGTTTAPDVPSVQVDATPRQTSGTGVSRSPFTPLAAGRVQSSGRSTGTKPTLPGEPRSVLAPSAGAASNSTGGGIIATLGGHAGASSTPSSQSPTPSSQAPAGGSPVNPAPISPESPAKQKRVSSGLSPTESYDVTLSMETRSGGVNTMSSVERLSELPSSANPLLVELGVLKGGGRVLFAVRPGGTVSGPGTCVPGPIDCEVVSLADGQIENLAGGSQAPTQFAVTGISVRHHGSVRAAQAARAVASGAGRSLLGQDPLRAYSLFPYDAGLGAVVDQRNVTIGGL